MSNILEKLVSLLENTTNYYRTCFNEVMGFLKMSTSLHARLAAKMYLGDRDFLQVTENMQVIKSWRRTVILQIFKWDGQRFNLNKQVTMMVNYE